MVEGPCRPAIDLEIIPIIKIHDQLLACSQTGGTTGAIRLQHVRKSLRSVVFLPFVADESIHQPAKLHNEIVATDFGEIQPGF